MKRVFIIILLVLTLCPACFAEEFEINGEDFYNKTAEDIVSGRLDLNPINIINNLIKSVFEEISNTKALLKSILLIAAAAGILRILSDSFGNGETSDAAFFACFAVMTAAGVKIFAEVVGYGVEVIHSLCGFITKFEPIFVGLLASAGAVTQAAAFQPVMTASVYVLSVVVDKCILPLTYFSAVLGIVNNIGGRIEIGTLNKLLASVSKWLLTGVLTLFSTILALYGFGTAAVNNVTIKSIKFAVGSFVPVVGGILSDTIDTVLSGTNLLKNAVGTAGMITVISIAAVPIIKIWIMMMLLKITAAAIEPFSDKRITNVLIAVADSVTVVFSMVITSVMLFIISIGIILTSTGVSL
ncbi:MAG: stage III sporulation protein AE [Clostridia bacterium]|nr:stage III sporulation protein AE [Clostridia bacterium]